MKVLITGATGLIGKVLTEKFFSTGIKVNFLTTKKSKIHSFTLDSILEKTNSTDKKIDLLDIDVEGADLKVLKGFTIEKFKPELICVEIHEKEIKNSEKVKSSVSSIQVCI